jgi:hypothetical protein
MAVLIVIGIVLTIVGVVFGAYLTICFAIAREDRIKWSLRREASTRSARTARVLVSRTGSQRD